MTVRISHAARSVLAALTVLAALSLCSCASRLDASAIAMPTPAPGDIPGEIMSVTGAGFTICYVSRDDTYLVEVCGDLANARAAVTAQLPGVCGCTFIVRNTRDGDPHTPAQLVMQFWVDRTTGPGFTVTSSQIMDDGTIDVGISGDLRAADRALNKEFPGFITVHHQEAGVPL